MVEPGQQIVVVTDGIAEACGQDGRFGEERLRAELGGAASPVQAVQRLEGALQSFTGGSLDDDVAILALAPASAEARAQAGPLDRLRRSRSPARRASEPAVDDGCQELVERLFDAFNRRDVAEIVDLCDEEMEFFAVTAEEVGPRRPLRRRGGPAAPTSTTSPRSGRSC